MELELPDYNKEKTKNRYNSFIDWFDRVDISVRGVKLFPQGSFVSGTTIKPIEDHEEYDLDIGCKVNIPNFKN